mgnify:CR=1 FL=1
MVKRAARIAAALVMFCAMAAVAHAADLKDPNVIIKKSWAKISSLKSYSYVVWGEGWESDLSDIEKRTKNVSSEVGDKYGSKMASKGADAPKNTGKPKKMGYHVTFKYMKPYLSQMIVDQSDYVPKIIYGSILTYRPDKDASSFTVKPKISPMPIKRDIGSESGTLLYSSMHMQFIKMELMGMDIKPVFKGVKKFEGKDCYVVAYVVPKGKKLKEHKVDFKKWKDIPFEARPLIVKEAKGLLDKPFSSKLYYFDKSTLWLVGIEEFDAAGKLRYSNWWRNIKENTLSDKDF